MKFIAFDTKNSGALEPDWENLDCNDNFPYSETVNFILDYFKNYNIKIINSGMIYLKEKEPEYFCHFVLDDFPTNMSWFNAMCEKYNID